MTEEEMAEEYIKKNNLEWEIECHRTNPVGEVYQAFLAGYKEGKPKWHKVADGDLPLDNRDVLSDKGDIAYYDLINECWVDNRASIEIDNVDAWTELPKFEEE